MHKLLCEDTIPLRVDRVKHLVPAQPIEQISPSRSIPLGCPDNHDAECNIRIPLIQLQHPLQADAPQHDLIANTTILIRDRRIIDSLRRSQQLGGQRDEIIVKNFISICRRIIRPFSLNILGNLTPRYLPQKLRLTPLRLPVESLHCLGGTPLPRSASAFCFPFVPDGTHLQNRNQLDACPC